MVKCWPLRKGSGASAVCGPFGISCCRCGEGLAGADEVDTLCVVGPGEGSREPKGWAGITVGGSRRQEENSGKASGRGEGRRIAGGTYTGDGGGSGRSAGGRQDSFFPIYFLS